MKILLVDPAEQMSAHSWSEVQDITGRFGYMPNLALPTLASLIPNDVEVTIVDETVEPLDFTQEWDLVGITGYITDQTRMFQIADEFRRRGQLVAIGGPFARNSGQVFSASPMKRISACGRTVAEERVAKGPPMATS